MEVDVDLARLARLVLVHERAEVEDPGVVDHHVERSEVRLDAVEEVLERGRVRHVELVRPRARADRPGRLGVDVADPDTRPLARQGGRRGAADAARAAGDGDDFSLQRAGRASHGRNAN